MDRVRRRPALEGDSMARSIAYSARGTARRMRGWADALATLKRRLLESLGFALLLVCFLLVLALLTYDPRDPSLNTAGDAAPHNFLGYSGVFGWCRVARRIQRRVPRVIGQQCQHQQK